MVEDGRWGMAADYIRGGIESSWHRKLFVC